MRQISAAALILALTVTAACSDPTTSAPHETGTPQPVEEGGLPAPAGLLVSNPQSLASDGAPERSAAYVSAMQGTFAGADSIVVRNETTGARARAPQIVDEGFDPVGIDARVGDKLSVKVFPNGSGTSSRFVVTTPARRLPMIVRTSPVQGETGVPMSGLARVIFSEPIDSSSLITSVAILRGRTPIEGTVTISVDGLSVTIRPAMPMTPETIYSLDVDDGIRDKDGDILGNASAVAFTTESAIAEGGQLLYVSLLDRQIYRINIDGTGLTRLTDRGRQEFPAWSPDGRRIAFSRTESGGGFASDIYIMNGDGSNVVRRTVGSSFRIAAWSPDGRKLAVSEAGVYDSDVWLISADDDGSLPIRLARQASMPAWSPDGKKIASVRLSGDDGYHYVFVMNADGSDAHAVTEMDPGGIYGLAWSPNGKRIAYSKCLNARCDLYAIDADGANASEITRVGNAQWASWSPDGASISLVLSTYYGNQWAPTVAYVSAAGGTPRVVVPDGYQPSWRP